MEIELRTSRDISMTVHAATGHDDLVDLADEIRLAAKRFGQIRGWAQAQNRDLVRVGPDLSLIHI